MSNPLLDIFEGNVGLATPVSWPNDHADKGYIICFTGRCGSTELVDVLGQSQACGQPDEYFNEEFIPHHNLHWQAKSLDEYIHKLIKYRSTGRIFGFKIDGFRHRRLCEATPPEKFFPKDAFKFFYMTRNDLCEQAFSFAHAKASGIWHVRAASELPAGDASNSVQYSDKDVWKEVALVLEQEFYFERYFVETRIEPLRFNYEMLCASKASLLTDIMLKLELPVGVIKTALAQVKPALVKLTYAEDRQGRIMDFRAQFGPQISYLQANRGRLPYASVRNFLVSETGMDISAP